MSRIARRTFLVSGALCTSLNPSLSALQNAWEPHRFRAAASILQQAVDRGDVQAAALFVQAADQKHTASFGRAKEPAAAFLLGSISKPITMTALMSLFADGQFDLDDPVQRYLPEFQGDRRQQVTLRHLLTHVSGLPDQVPQNATLRAGHAALERFVAAAMAIAPEFEPGTQYQYSSMGILLAAEVAQRVTGVDIKQLVSDRVLQPLDMSCSALGTGGLTAEQMMDCQVEFGAVESGAGSPESRTWDWNSRFWRNLGAPWGGVQASAEDVGRFLQEFLRPSGKLFPRHVAELMICNHNPPHLPARGLGFDVGMQSHCQACSERTFGHTGSTGTIAWADPTRDLICVVLTTLPAGAVPAGQHPRQLASDIIAGG